MARGHDQMATGTIFWFIVVAVVLFLHCRADEKQRVQNNITETKTIIERKQIMRGVIVELLKNGKLVGYGMVTPTASTGLWWKRMGDDTWIDSSDKEIEFDESRISR